MGAPTQGTKRVPGPFREVWEPLNTFTKHRSRTSGAALVSRGAGREPNPQTFRKQASERANGKDRHTRGTCLCEQAHAGTGCAKWDSGLPVSLPPSEEERRERKTAQASKERTVHEQPNVRCSENVETWTRCLHLLHQLQEAGFGKACAA